MSNLSMALLETHQIELEPTDVIRFEHNYCGYHIVDVVVFDPLTGCEARFECFDTRLGIFPY